MKFFSPKLRTGHEVSFPIQIRAYKYNFLWPLEEQAPMYQHILYYTARLLLLLAYIGTLIGEFTFLKENFTDILAVSECLTTTCVGMEYIIRIILWLRKQHEVRVLYRRFYKEIYFTSADDPELCRQIRFKMRIPDFSTKVYYITMLFIYLKFAWDIYNTNMSETNKPYIYLMSFRWYDAQEPWAYVLTAIYTGWLTFSCGSIMGSEDFSLCLMLCHMSYRVKELQNHLHGMLEEARFESNYKNGITGHNDVHRIFQRKLYALFRKQQKLYSFVAEAKSYFTHQIFYCLGFSVIGLCVVAFQFQMTNIGLGWVKYPIWLISQMSHLLMIGYFGQKLLDATSEMQNSYYMCHWEELLQHGDVRSNRILMHDIKFAIMNAQNRVVFDGLNFISLTHDTVGAALRSAVSYFMFLNTMNDGGNK